MFIFNFKLYKSIFMPTQKCWHSVRFLSIYWRCLRL